MDISWRIDALIRVENGLSISADVEHRDSGQYHATDSMGDRKDVAAIQSLLDWGHLAVDSRPPVRNQMDRQTESKEVGQRENRELEVVDLVVIRSLH